MEQAFSTSQLEDICFERRGILNELAHRRKPAFFPPATAGSTRVWFGPALYSVFALAFLWEHGYTMEKATSYAEQVFHHLTDHPDANTVLLETGIVSLEIDLRDLKQTFDLDRRIVEYG